MSSGPWDICCTHACLASYTQSTHWLSTANFISRWELISRDFSPFSWALYTQSCVTYLSRFLFFSFSYNHAVFVPSSISSHTGAEYQEMLCWTLFCLGYLVPWPWKSLGFHYIFYIHIFVGCAQWSASFRLSSLLFHHHQIHPNIIFVSASLLPLSFPDVFPHLPSVSHTLRPQAFFPSTAVV